MVDAKSITRRDGIWLVFLIRSLLPFLQEYSRLFQFYCNNSLKKVGQIGVCRKESECDLRIERAVKERGKEGEGETAGEEGEL